VKSPCFGPEGKAFAEAEHRVESREEGIRGALEKTTAERRASEALFRDGKGSLASVLEARERETGLQILSWSLWRERQVRRVNLFLSTGDAGCVDGVNQGTK
jgi:hypothetical protein